ncbi:hypothetical protein H6B10_17805, partial [Gemmiger formicilis]|nr:hypothetical protein [Gemmiger formicilis]
MLFTSTPTHCWPKKAVSSGLPRPRLWPGTSKGTTRMRREQVAKAIAEHPNAVAVLVNNPTYYGICSDLRAIV